MRLIPLGILAAITFLGLGINLTKHGKKKEGKYNIGVTILAALTDWGLILWAVL